MWQLIHLLEMHQLTFIDNISLSSSLHPPIDIDTKDTERVQELHGACPFCPPQRG